MRDKQIRCLVVASSTGTHHYRNRRNASLALRIVEPLISRTIGKTVYDDMRRMEDIVGNSALDWTIVRPSTLFDSDHVSRYTAGDVPPVDAYTARIDLAHYLANLLGDPATVGSTPIVSITDSGRRQLTFDPQDELLIGDAAPPRDDYLRQS